jgi:hypothetical protein
VNLATLRRVGSDAELIASTGALRGALQAFNRRHAVDAIERWADRLDRLAGALNPGPPGVYADAQCTMLADGATSAAVQDGLAEVDKAWPGFRGSFDRVVRAVAAVRSVSQAHRAALRPLVVAIDPNQSTHGIAAALVAETARTSVQVLERIGVTAPDYRCVEQGTWGCAGPTEFGRVAGLLATAAYLDEIGAAQPAAAKRRLATALLAAQPDVDQLTPVGRTLRDALNSRADGKPASPREEPTTLATVVSELESIDASRSCELVRGLTKRMFRFQWSTIGQSSESTTEDVPPVGGAMDVGLPPWLPI